MLKRFSILVLVGLSLGILWTSSAKAQFSDVPRDHWAYDAVDYLADEGFVVGYPDGTFKGDNLLTRYEFAMVITRLYNQFLELLDETGPDESALDTEAILNMLMEEFQPELDELRELIAENEGRITALEGTVGDMGGQLTDLTARVDALGAPFKPYAELNMRFYGTYPEKGNDSQRPQYDMKFGFTAPVNDELVVGVRFGTGAKDGTQTHNDTWNDNFGFDEVTLSRAYLVWQPNAYPGFTAWGGKFAPPWITTPMAWSGDVQVEGMAQHFKWNEFNFYLGELVPAEEGFYLVAQVSTENFLIDGTRAAITYHYINDDAWKFIKADMMSGKLKNNWDFARLETPEDYRAIEGYGEFQYGIAGVDFQIKGSYMMNLEDTAPGLEDEAGWQQAAWASLAINDLKLKDPGDWQVWGEWGRIQPNSAISWLNDATRGTTDVEYWLGGVKYRLLANADLVAYYINRETLSDDPQLQTEIVVVQLNTKFN